MLANCSRGAAGVCEFPQCEPTTGLHPSDVAKLMTQLNGLVESGNTVIVVEPDRSVTAASDWITDIGPGADDEGGRIVAADHPTRLLLSTKSDCDLSCASTVKGGSKGDLSCSSCL
jgi:excinuclease UvrABC ATPase subunit